jgi:magnesium transporter
MAGISEDVDVDDSVWASSRARLPWLLIGMAGGLAGAQLMDLFGTTRTLIPAMTLFVPLITATGGNVGIQSSTVIIQTIANKSFLGTNFTHTFLRMMLVALVNAVVIGGLVFIFLTLWGQPLNLSLLVTIALFSVVVLASVMGTVTPVVLDRFGVNPALASGPFITTANDLLGLTVYFSVAHLLISIFGL